MDRPEHDPDQTHSPQHSKDTEPQLAATEPHAGRMSAPKGSRLLAIALGAGLLAGLASWLIGEFTGPFADYGTQIYNGIKAYLKQNGDVFGGRKVEFVVKDTTGAVPDRAKRLAVDAVTQDGVDILAGFGLTPNALTTAPVSAEAVPRPPP